MNIQYILTEIEQAIAVPAPHIEILPVDRWLTFSILQKSIRRGDVRTAQRATLTLWQTDKRSLWTRLHLIALEDCGIASPDVVTKTLTAFNATAWRTKTDDLVVALYLSQLLCEANKTRLADELYSIISRGPQYADLRHELSKANDRTLADLALNEKRSLPERCLSLWYLAGTKRYPFDGAPMRSGNIEAAAEVMRSLGSFSGLTDACISCLKKSPWPLALITPLLAADMNKQKVTPTLVTKSYPAVYLRDVPLPALDMFTRIGRTCFAELKKSAPGLKPFLIPQIGTTIFYLEGFRIDKRLTSPALDEHRRAGAAADIRFTGLTGDSFAELKDILISHTDMLETIRRRQLEAYFKSPENQHLLVKA